MAKPNLFIAGAPKCGTTALYRYLSEHPDIYFSPRKEPQYFGSDFKKRPLNSYQHIATEEDYLKLFEQGNGKTYIGEASTAYFYSTSAASEIYNFSPEAKIIIMLRDPVEMMYSLYYQQLELGIEELESFEAALNAETFRQKGEMLNSRVYIPQSLCYRYIATYTQHIQRYCDVFGHSQLKIILYDDFKSDTAQVYREVLKFLNLNDDFRVEFPVVNANSQPRMIWLRNFLANPPQLFLTVGKAMLPIARPIYRWLRASNSKSNIRPAISQETKKQLRLELQAEIKKLEGMLERDLSHWCEE